MKNTILALMLCSIVSCQAALSSEDIFPVASKEMVWNKWETENFIILSINYSFGDKLKSRIESIKSDLCEEWGIQDAAFSSKCKIVCVPDEKMLSKFFSVDFPKFEAKKGSDEMSIWIDEGRLSFFKRLMLSALLKNKPAYIQRGVPLLATSVDNIAEGIVLLDKPDFLKTISSDDSIKSSDTVFDFESLVVCLFLRREFGIEVFSSVLKGKSPESACGFSDKDSFASSLGRYFENLKNDLKSGKTPDAYLSP